MQLGHDTTRVQAPLTLPISSDKPAVRLMARTAESVLKTSLCCRPLQPSRVSASGFGIHACNVIQELGVFRARAGCVAFREVVTPIDKSCRHIVSLKVTF